MFILSFEKSIEIDSNAIESVGRMRKSSKMTDTRQRCFVINKRDDARWKWPNQMAAGESISVHSGSVGERLPGYSHLPVLASTNSPANQPSPLHSFFLFPLQKSPVGAATSYLPPFSTAFPSNLKKWAFVQATRDRHLFESRESKRRSQQKDPGATADT